MGCFFRRRYSHLVIGLLSIAMNLDEPSEIASHLLPTPSKHSETLLCERLDGHYPHSSPCGMVTRFRLSSAIIRHRYSVLYPLSKTHSLSEVDFGPWD